MSLSNYYRYWRVYSDLFRLFDRDVFSFKNNFILPSKQHSFKLEAVNDTKVKACYMKKDTILKELTIRTKLDNGGYLNLDNHNIRIFGIPYVFGAIDETRLRLRKNQENNLVVDVAYHHGGALGLVGFINWTTLTYRQVFQRIK